jgi:hypothetical protein
MASDHQAAAARSIPPPPLLYLLPTIGNIIFVSLFIVLAFNSGNGLLGDGDSGYHIRTGQVILATWNIPRKDIYSFHTPPLKWTAHEWLAELIMALVHKTFGLTGVVLSFSVLLAATHWLLYRTLRSRSDDIILCTLVTLLATAASSSHWLARPHVFSLFLTLLWYRRLDGFQYRDEGTLYWLPVLMLCWVNLHGGFVIGLILLGLYIIGNVLGSIGATPTQSHRARQKAKTLLFWLLITTAVCCANPIGYEILFFPFRITSDRFLMDRVAEFLSPNFHDVLPFKYMFLVMIGLLAVSRSVLNLTEVALITLFSYMSLYSVRHVSLYAIMAAPILLRLGQDTVRRMPAQILRFYRQRVDHLNAIESKISGTLWPSVVVALIVFLSLTGRLRYDFNADVFPVAAVEFLKKEPITGRMFNNDEFGDYMIFAAWPEYRVFMDGRSDMYGEKFGNAYLKVANALPGWKDVLTKFDVSWLIFDTRSPISSALVEQTDWQAIYSDKVATIFVKKTKEHQALLAKHPPVDLATK